jgi:hypothetical protein
MRVTAIGLFAALTLVAGPVSAQGAAVSYTISGSSGSWLLDFEVTNLFPTSVDMNAYLLGLQLGEPQAYASTPTGWTARTTGMPYTYEGDGNGTYDNVWHTPTLGSSLIGPGETLGGFGVHLTGAVAPSSVEWLVTFYGEDTYDGDDAYYVTEGRRTQVLNRPSFKGVATAQRQTVPEPASMALLFTGLVGVAGVAYRRRED